MGQQRKCLVGRGGDELDEVHSASLGRGPRVCADGHGERLAGEVRRWMSGRPAHEEPDRRKSRRESHAPEIMTRFAPIDALGRWRRTGSRTTMRESRSRIRRTPDDRGTVACEGAQKGVHSVN